MLSLPLFNIAAWQIIICKDNNGIVLENLVEWVAEQLQALQ